MKLTADTYTVCNFLREDILNNLRYDGVSEIISYYDDIDENMVYDPSLFWIWNRYDSAFEALKDNDDGSLDEILKDAKENDFDASDIEDRCLEVLQDITSVIEMGDGTVIVNTEF
jgi:hypothetical protein